jgi:hypothetical protein
MSQIERLKIKLGETTCRNEEEAVQELFSKVYQPDMEAVIFFCSSMYNLDKLGIELKKNFFCSLIGCTTAGEISSKGYQKGGIVGVSLSARDLKLHARFISSLDRFSLSEAQKITDEIRKELLFCATFDKEKTFGLLMIDGLSIMEEQVISFLYNQLDGISIIGGSAGDDLRFKETKIYWDGHFVSDAAVFTLFETTLPFYVFKTQHFKPTEKKLVITGADPFRRIVTEINAEPAAQEFARILGLPITDLNPMIFSKFPLMLKLGDHWYVRSIQKVNEDESLSFFCAIDVGLVLTVARGDDLVSDLKDELESICRKIPEPKLIIGFDCILRKLEILEKDLLKDVGNLLNKLNFVGFSTYGEQYDSVHVNQTLTGVAIGG